MFGGRATNAVLIAIAGLGAVTGAILILGAGVVFASHSADCTGEVINNIYHDYGTNGSDNCDGHAHFDKMYGYEGGDTFNANSYADELFMGNGYDYAYGEAGHDILHGGPGNDLGSDYCCTGDTDVVCGYDGSDSHNVDDDDTQDGVYGGADGTTGQIDPGETLVTNGTCPY